MRMTRRALLGAAMATATIGMARPAAAQISPEDLLLQLDGLEGAWSRKYIADRKLGFATPAVADDATPDTLLATVLDFATVEDATRAFATRLNGLTARLILGEPELSLEETAIDGLGDRAAVYTGVRDHHEPEHVALMAVRDGDLGMLLSAWGADGSIVKTVEGVARFMVAAAPGDGPVEVGEFGASGGVFDLMPTMADAELLRGLVPMYDYDLLRDGGEEPLEHIEHDPAGDEATPAG